MFTKVSTLAFSIALLAIGTSAFAIQHDAHSGHKDGKSDCACCMSGAAAAQDVITDLDKRIADMEKEIAAKGNFLLNNIHGSSKGPIRAKDCLAILKKDRDAAIKHKDSKPDPNSLVWVGKTHVRYSELPKPQQATARVCDHNGYRWITVGKSQWRIKNCAEIPAALRPQGSQKVKVACCQGGTCCGSDSHCTTSGCCKKDAGCCEKAKDGTTVCNSKCGCILSCHS